MRGRPAPLRERPPGAAGASRTAALLTPLRTPLLVALAAGVFMALVGAFGTGPLPLPLRLAYWVGVIGAGAVIGTIVGRTVRGRGWLEDRRWLQAGLILLLMFPPITVLVWAITSSTIGPDAGWTALPRFLGPVFAVCLVMTAVTDLAQGAPPQTHAAAAGAAPPRFLDRLPPKLRGAEIFAVEAEDHYLRIHTSRGSDLLLMRLGDAIAELEGIEGSQTHRSWWVARSAVESARRGDGRAVLTLKGGVQAPVSRTFARTLRDQGWF